MEHIPISVTNESRANLMQLAAYLLSLPGDYKSFHMGQFFSREDREVPGEPIGAPAVALRHRVSECGTVACAAGHSFAAGMREPRTFREKRSWINYMNNVYFQGARAEDMARYWIFGGGWVHTDNTPRGAAYRIYYMLEHGIPADWRDQINGIAPLSYWPTEGPEKKTRRQEQEHAHG